VATGVVPNSDNLGLENTKIQRKEGGFLRVNDYLETSEPGVYAIGDVVGNYMFRHSANFEGEYLFRSLFTQDRAEVIQYPPVPYAVFTHPQIAGVGLTETEAKNAGLDYVVGLTPYSKSAMGQARLSDHGFVKILVERESRQLLGAHIIGDEAATMAHIFILAMTVGATLDHLLEMIYIHPALPEITRNACRAARSVL
jgi:dihydrolipoamide dehydrogenase